ncbi:class I SAM-dependent methyltransferase [Mycobacterium sp.]|uniref:class I SAM-dependent methyltransferase n=1 Tax=Mycobacterium sp. TaxID=1785 RepID=UPI0025D40F20|nr:class I SAM-dependent methyltransferase [Mycobacterium sp.]
MTGLHKASSIRSEGDSWDITESVGATALSVAAARAVETGSADPLIRDQFAYLLVSTAGQPWARLATSLDWIGDDDHGRRAHRLAVDYQAVRTHYFDTYFTEAAAAGIRQVVILAAGLDSRAFRLEWPIGTTVYEIDQPQVVAYKTATLESAGAEPAAERRTVQVDLRDDWAAALTAAGFDPGLPTAWLAEGLLPYLPAEAQDRLFEIVTGLSAPGSRVAVEAFSLGAADSESRRAARRARFDRMRQRLGLDINVETLTYQENGRADAADWLREHGWRVDAVRNADEMARLGRAIPDDLADEAFTTTLLSAELGAR